MRSERAVPFLPSLNVKRLSLIAVLCVVVSCRSGGPEEETVTNIRPMVDASAVSYGDCVEARRRAAAKPDLDVDSVPRPVSQRPRPFANMPAAVKAQIDTKGAAIKADVVVDTLGRADMKSFRVVSTSHPWLGENLKASMPTWTFRAARLAGCKVARVYHFSATSRPRKS
jgi:hypothetical protein